MKKFSYVLAALAAVAFALPSIASAEDAKMEGMKKEGMMHHDKHMMTRHHPHHHAMKKEMKHM